MNIMYILKGAIAQVHTYIELKRSQRKVHYIYVATTVRLRLSHHYKPQIAIKNRRLEGQDSLFDVLHYR